MGGGASRRCDRADRSRLDQSRRCRPCRDIARRIRSGCTSSPKTARSSPRPGNARRTRATRPVRAACPPEISSQSAAERELALLSARPGPADVCAGGVLLSRRRAGARTARHAATGAYSGFYLDLGGRGLVSTITQPLLAPNGQHAVAALDLAFEIDWQRFAASVDRADQRCRGAGGRRHARVLGRRSTPRFRPDASPALRAATAALASRDRQPLGDHTSPVRHGLVDDAGALAAFQVSEATWLLMLFPQTAPAFPVAAVVALAGLLALLLAGFELNRRRAEGERQKSQQALAEKQNLLNTMQVPLVVVDPNTDVIVSSNRAAETIGIQRRQPVRGSGLAARIGRARTISGCRRPARSRAAPTACRWRCSDERGELHQRYAIVRSVAVTAPIEALAADERHRLGVLFVLEPDADLALLAEDLERDAHRDERRRLAGLLSHGVATLARVLEHCLSRPDPDAETRELTKWLAEYLERRLTVASWLLDHWDASPPLDRDSVVDAEQCRVTIASVRGDLPARAGRPRASRATPLGQRDACRLVAGRPRARDVRRLARVIRDRLSGSRRLRAVSERGARQRRPSRPARDGADRHRPRRSCQEGDRLSGRKRDVVVDSPSRAVKRTAAWRS